MCRPRNVQAVSYFNQSERSPSATPIVTGSWFPPGRPKPEVDHPIPITVHVSANQNATVTHLRTGSHSSCYRSKPELDLFTDPWEPCSSRSVICITSHVNQIFVCVIGIIFLDLEIYLGNKLWQCMGFAEGPPAGIMQVIDSPWTAKRAMAIDWNWVWYVCDVRWLPRIKWLYVYEVCLNPMTDLFSCMVGEMYIAFKLCCTDDWH